MDKDKPRSPMPEHQRRAISLAKKGKPLSEAHRKAISAAHSHKPRTAEQKEVLRQSNLGKVRTEETKRKLSEAHMGKTRSQEAIEKQIATHKASGPHKGRRYAPVPVEIRGVRYASISEAAEALRCSPSNISIGLRDGRPGFIRL